MSWHKYAIATGVADGSDIMISQKTGEKRFFLFFTE